MFNESNNPKIPHTMMTAEDCLETAIVEVKNDPDFEPINFIVIPVVEDVPDACKE